MYYYYPVSQTGGCSSCEEEARASMMPTHTPWMASPHAGTPMAGMPGGAPMTGGAPTGGGMPMDTSGPMQPPGAGGAAGGAPEESYIENILRFNRGKIATLHFTYENNSQWNAQTVRGRIETAGRDHIIVSDPQTGKRFLLLMMNLDWVEFDGPVAYIRPTVPPQIQGALTEG